MITYKETPRPP